MKTMIAIGLVMLSLLLLVALRRPSSAPHPVPESTPASAESQRIYKAALSRRAAPHPLQANSQRQPVHASLVAAVEAETDSDRRSDALERAVESVSNAGLRDMLDSVVLDKSPAATELILLLVRRWAESDPQAAATWTLQHSEIPVNRAALEQVAIAWANSDLPAATSWVRTLPQDSGKITATLALAYESARTEPVVALELASGLSPTRERDDLLVHAVSQWAATDSTRATAWAMNVADPLLRQRLVASVAIAVADQDATAAATLAVSGLAQGEEQNRATVSIVQRWAQRSPQAAAFWISQFPNIPLREVALQNLLAIWTSQDATAVSQWMSELPDSPLHLVGFVAQVQAAVDATRIQGAGGAGGEL